MTLFKMEKYDTFHSLPCAPSATFRVLHIHFVRLTLANVSMTRVSDHWSDDRDHVGTVVIRCRSLEGRIPDLG